MAINKNVFTGADGAITLAPSQGKEGDTAKGIISAYDTLTVGRVQNVSVEVHAEVLPYYEIGQRYATELRSGNVSIKGSIGRAYINGALIKLLLGDAADKRPAASWTQPTFNITLILENNAVPGVRSTVTLNDVKLDKWMYSVLQDDFVLENANFQALYLTIQDES